MKLGMFTGILAGRSLVDVLDFAVSIGCEAVELGSGNYAGNAHCDVDALLADESAVTRLKSELDARGLVISSLSQHGNPLHPDESVAARAHATWLSTIEAAEQLGVKVVNAFSGCPGDHPGARYPNWVTCPWPPDFLNVLDWQWEERLIPYWTKEAERARDSGVTIGFEMHPGMAVYNPLTLLRLRDACGVEICCNFDPSHLFWQGIDPTEAIVALGARGTIVHVHAKDVAINIASTRQNGVLDTRDYTMIAERSWSFRTVGWGHGGSTWRAIVSALATHGYDGVISIEHEDGLMTAHEGLAKAADMLRPVLIRQPADETLWR